LGARGEPVDSGDDSEVVTPVEDGGNLRMRPFGPLLISLPRDTLDSSDTMGGGEVAGALISGKNFSFFKRDHLVSEKNVF
jgi:hypothetical protein